MLRHFLRGRTAATSSRNSNSNSGGCGRIISQVSSLTCSSTPASSADGIAAVSGAGGARRDAETYCNRLAGVAAPPPSFLSCASLSTKMMTIIMLPASSSSSVPRCASQMLNEHCCYDGVLSGAAGAFHASRALLAPSSSGKGKSKSHQKRIEFFNKKDKTSAATSSPAAHGTNATTSAATNNSNTNSGSSSGGGVTVGLTKKKRSKKGLKSKATASATPSAAKAPVSHPSPPQPSSSAKHAAVSATRPAPSPSSSSPTAAHTSHTRVVKHSGRAEAAVSSATGVRVSGGHHAGRPEEEEEATALAGDANAAADDDDDIDDDAPLGGGEEEEDGAGAGDSGSPITRDMLQEVTVAEGEEGSASSSAGAAAAPNEAEELELAGEVTEIRSGISDAPDGGEDAAGAAGDAPAVGSLLDFENPLNLRLATLTRQGGKAFRAIVVEVPATRTTINFEVAFVDVASRARLVCRVQEIKKCYYDWIEQFRASFVALFLPSLQGPNEAMVMGAIHNARPARPAPPKDVRYPTINEEPDHLFLSCSKLAEVVARKREHTLTPDRLTSLILDAYPDDWKNFIHAPNACLPQAFFTASFSFQQAPNASHATLNKELLHAQLATAAEALLAAGHGSAGGAGSSASSASAGGGASASAASGKGMVARYASSAAAGAQDVRQWSLIFVSAPPRGSNGVVSAIPPMQDLVTGQFVEPLTLSERRVIYVIGTGDAAESFARFPTQRKGKVCFSIMLADIASQLGQHQPHGHHNQRFPGMRPGGGGGGGAGNLTNTLIRALDSFSRVTWMGLMEAETGELRKPRPAASFFRVQRRAVHKEIVPTFLESVFAPSQRMGDMGSSGGQMGGGGQTGDGGGGDPTSSAQQLMTQHIARIYNDQARFEREKDTHDEMRGLTTIFLHVNSVGVTAARRVDNPFSSRNGMVEALSQTWPSLGLANPPSIYQFTAPTDEQGNVRRFISADRVLEKCALPVGPRDAAKKEERACNAVIVAWDVKRVLLFLRESRLLRRFLRHGGRVWCAQYGQYLLRGFNHEHLATPERTLLQLHDGAVKARLNPLAKLKVIYTAQLDLALAGRQLISLVHRMDGLLAASEMEKNGLQLAPQSEISAFSVALQECHTRLEQLLQDKIAEFTQGLDDDVRARLNFRSTNDIATLIYGGGFGRHLSARFLPVLPTRYPITALLPHLVCRVTGTPLPQSYADPRSLTGSGGSGGGANNHNNNSGSGGTHMGGGLSPSSTANIPGGAASATNEVLVTDAAVKKSLAAAAAVRAGKAPTMDQLVSATAVVVVNVRCKMGGLLERISLYCPAVGGSGLDLRVAVDEVLPVEETPTMVTLPQLKRIIREWGPLRTLLKHTKSKTAPLRNVLILTSTHFDRLSTLVDTGVARAIAETVLGPELAAAGAAPGGLERVCFADMAKAFPPPPQASDSFAGDFSDLTATAAAPFAAGASWKLMADPLSSLGGTSGVMRAVISHCASTMGGPRDTFRSPFPLPSMAPEGLHGQERASTEGMLWQATPPRLHPALRTFLKGAAASTSADAMERVTVFLAGHKGVDLSFFTSLQQLRFTEKKMQLFEEGCLFRAVLPECHDRVHGELCHCVTATGRLSSQSPNLQNIPREDDLRRLLRSRFGPSDGRIIEADYSQLEVMVLAALSREPRMIAELRDRVDFHCLRVALMRKEPYEEVVHKVKTLKDPTYVQLRQQAKVFSFQRQYGAGVTTIATTTGLTVQEVEALIAAEGAHYTALGPYYQMVTRTVEAGADRLLRMRTLDAWLWNAHTRRVVTLTDPAAYFPVHTGSKFNFAKDRKSVPKLKNYPVQGLAGEIVQIMCGRIARHFFERDNYQDRAFLVNTVHDCVWVDCHKAVAQQVMEDVRRLMGNTQEEMRKLWPDFELDVPFNVDVKMGVTLGDLKS